MAGPITVNLLKVLHRIWALYRYPGPCLGGLPGPAERQEHSALLCLYRNCFNNWDIKSTMFSCIIGEYHVHGVPNLKDWEQVSPMSFRASMKQPANYISLQSQSDLHKVCGPSTSAGPIRGSLVHKTECGPDPSVRKHHKKQYTQKHIPLDLGL